MSITKTTAQLAPIAQPSDRNPALVYLASLAPGSRRTLREALDTMADLLLPGTTLDTFPWAALRFQHTQALRSALAERYSAATVNKMLSALRGTLLRARRLGQMAAEEYEAACDLPTVKGDKPDQAAGRALSLGELIALLGVCAADDSPAGARDAAIISLAYACGLRRAELASLELADFDHHTNTLTIHGKRNKTRTVPMANGALEALEDWLTIRGAAPGSLFVRIIKGGDITWALNRGEGLSAQAIYFIMQQRAEQAGVEPFSPHDMRRTFAGDLLDAGADIVTVQKLMGHANANTTAGYDRRGERAKRDAVQKLHVPYKGRRR